MESDGTMNLLHRTRVVGLVAGLAMLFASACGGATAPASPTAAAPAAATPSASPTPVPVTGKVTVFAASSLADVFKAIGASFQKENPGVTVEFNFGASSAIEAQLEQAAPADVFASADTANMQKAIDKGLPDGAAVTFARNLPVVVVPADNRAAILTPKDLAKPGTKIVFAAPEVPIGNYARQIIDKLAADPAFGAAFKDAVTKNIVSNEASVKAVLTKIELGEADAGIVYKTDALVSGAKVKTVAVPGSANVIATYPIAVIKTTKNRDASAAFVAYVAGPAGQQALKTAGFDAAK